MGLNFKEIEPNTTKKSIDNDHNLFLVDDHVPDIEHLIDIDHTELENLNSLDYLFDNRAKEKLFIFNYYLGFEKFKDNGFFYPSFFIGNIHTYHNDLEPKIFDYDWSKKIVPLNCLLNKERIHRILVSHWLVTNYEWKTNLIYSQPWPENGSKRHNHAKKLFNRFSERQVEGKFSQLPSNWYTFQQQTPSEYQYAQNVEIFNEVLHPQVFAKSIISLVIEPDFWVNACSVTEKYINAVVGLTIPVITGYKIYEKLELLKFDTFKDIINTDYQYEKEPTKRILRMLDENKELFDNAHNVIDDEEIKNRLLKNREHLFDDESIKKLSRENLNTSESESKFSHLTNHILTYFRNHNCSW